MTDPTDEQAAIDRATRAYTIEQTGGGCTALVRAAPSGRVVVVTNGNVGHTLTADGPAECVVFTDRAEWEHNDGGVPEDEWSTWEGMSVLDVLTRAAAVT